MSICMKMKVEYLWDTAKVLREIYSCKCLHLEEKTSHKTECFIV